MPKSKKLYVRDNSKKGKRQRRQKLIETGIVILSVVLGLIIAFWPNAYRIIIDDVVVGMVKERDYITKSLETVVAQLEQTYKTTVKLEGEEDIIVERARGRQKDYITTNYLITYMRNNMDFYLEFYEVQVDGKSIAVVQDENIQYELLDTLSKIYLGQTAPTGQFASNVEFVPVFAKEAELTSLDELIKLATTTREEEVTYEVKAGDTLSGIAAKLNISLVRLISANEGMSTTSTINVGNKLNAVVDVPLINVEPANSSVEYTIDAENIDMP